MQNNTRGNGHTHASECPILLAQPWQLDQQLCPTTLRFGDLTFPRFISFPLLFITQCYTSLTSYLWCRYLLCKKKTKSQRQRQRNSNSLIVLNKSGTVVWIFLFQPIGAFSHSVHSRREHDWRDAIGQSNRSCVCMAMQVIASFSTSSNFTSLPLVDLQTCQPHFLFYSSGTPPIRRWTFCVTTVHLSSSEILEFFYFFTPQVESAFEFLKSFDFFFPHHKANGELPLPTKPFDCEMSQAQPLTSCAISLCLWKTVPQCCLQPMNRNTAPLRCCWKPTLLSPSPCRSFKW